MSSYVYRLYDSDNRRLYVGLAQNVDRRLGEHVHKPWWPAVEGVAVSKFDSRDDAREAETAAIVHELPAHNRVHSTTVVRVVKDTSVTLRLDGDVVDRIDKMAEAEGRSRSDAIRRLVLEALLYREQSARRRK